MPAIAVQLALNVVEPQNSGLGGGSFFVRHDGKSGEFSTIDGHEAAPAAATPNWFLGADGRPLPSARSAAAGARRACPARCASWRSRTSAMASCPGRGCSSRPSAWHATASSSRRACTTASPARPGACPPRIARPISTPRAGPPGRQHLQEPGACRTVRAGRQARAGRFLRRANGTEDRDRAQHGREQPVGDDAGRSRHLRSERARAGLRQLSPATRSAAWGRPPRVASRSCKS